ncbi:LuxR C-terminal-related transcriptional regulator [Citrobacter sp. VF227]
MLYILTNDNLLYSGLNYLYGESSIIKLPSIYILSEKDTSHDTLLIDVAYCKLTISQLFYIIQKTFINKIIFLSAFRFSNLKPNCPVQFIPRKINLRYISVNADIFYDGPKIDLPSLTLREFEIIRQTIRQYNDLRIASSLGISLATLRVNKYQIMLKLKIKKMSHVMYTEYYLYITGEKAGLIHH